LRRSLKRLPRSTVAAYEANPTGDLRLASRSFIPTGLFTPAGDSIIPPQARAIFAGHVLAADEKINVLTGRAFYWALVEAYGGAYEWGLTQIYSPACLRSVA
jgi:hypothetical protein